MKLLCSKQPAMGLRYKPTKSRQSNSVSMSILILSYHLFVHLDLLSSL